MKLFHGRTFVGTISDPLFSDETWYGTILINLSLANDEKGKQVLTFIEFCQDWHERLKKGLESSGDASEFNDFPEMVESDEWQLEEEPNGTRYHISCPYFFPGGEFTARPWEFMHSDD
jgi:hypothetical protein